MQETPTPEDPQLDESKSNGKKSSPILKLVIVAAIVAAIVVAFATLDLKGYLCSALAAIDGLGILAPIAFGALYVIATVFFLPGSVLTLGGGAIFGAVLGAVYVFLAATIGATAAFLVGRYLARGWVEKQIAGNKRFAAVDRAVAREGFKIVFLTRLSPIFPFNLLNYAYGVTQVSLRDYFFASAGMLPGTIMYVYFGSLAEGGLQALCAGEGGGAAAQAPSAAQWAIRIVGLIATVAVTVYVTKIARKALESEISDDVPAGGEASEG